MSALRQAAKAVVDRFDEPDDADLPGIATFIRRLRVALAAEQAQAVEPVAIYDIGVNEKLGAVHLLKQLKSGDKLYLHPGPPAQQVVVPAGYVLVPTETLRDIKFRVNTLATLSLKAERYSVGREIKQNIADMLAAPQGVKP